MNDSSRPQISAPDAQPAVRVPKFHRFFVDLSTDHIAFLERLMRERRLTSPSSALRIVLELAIERDER